jgi:microcystin-dependent protein
MAQFFLGQIIIGGWTFAPSGSVQCNGQQMSISQNSALFALLGTTYGGNGIQTFGLPNLQGRRIVHWGNGAGLSQYVIGQTGGSESVTANLGNLPTHTHLASFANNNSNLVASGAQPKASQSAPAAGSMLGHALDTSGKGTLPAIYVPAGSATTMVPLGGLNVAGTVTLAVSGSGLPLQILNPYNTVTMAIATVGIFPSRN